MAKLNVHPVRYPTFWLLVSLIHILIQLSTALQHPNARTFIAEWEFQKRPWRGNNNTGPLLRHRLGAGYWSEPGSLGDWWLFGGKGSGKQYSDLWRFHGANLKWERVYPRIDPVVRAMASPEKALQPVLCGHHTPGRTVLAVYGPYLHTDTVWLYEVNDTLWTSYVCCCEKENSKHAFCPDFGHSKQNPVAWCDTANGAILAVVPTTPVLQLWRFSLLTTRWEHVSLQTTTPSTRTTWNCNITDEQSFLYTSADGLLYILCSNSEDVKTKRYIYRYPGSNGEIESLGSITLNVVPSQITLSATRSTNGRIYLVLAYQQLLDIWLLDENTSSWVPIDNIWKGNALKWFQAISSSSGIYYLNIDGAPLLLSNPKLSEHRFDIGVIQEQGLFMINISQDDGSILRGDYTGKKIVKTETIPSTEMATSTSSSSTTESTTVTSAPPPATTTEEWTAELIMEGSSENISTCCWNFTETVSGSGSDRALLALAPPEVNELVKPMKSGSQIDSMRNDTYGALLFFAASISLFALGGIAIFVRRCVRCPPQRRTAISKEPPPIRYSVIPDELSYPSYTGA